MLEHIFQWVLAFLMKFYASSYVRILNKLGKYDMINYQGDELISYLF